MSARNCNDSSQSPTPPTSDRVVDSVLAGSDPNIILPSNGPSRSFEEKSFASAWQVPSPVQPIYGAMANHDYQMGYYHFGPYNPGNTMMTDAANPWAAGFSYTPSHQTIGSPPTSYDVFGHHAPPGGTTSPYGQPPNPYGSNVYDYVTNWSPSVVTHDTRPPHLGRQMPPTQPTDYFRTPGYGMNPDGSGAGMDSYTGLNHTMNAMSIVGQPAKQMDSGFGSMTQQVAPKAQTWADKVKQAGATASKPKQKPPIGGLPGSRPKPLSSAPLPPVNGGGSTAWTGNGPPITTGRMGGIGRGAPVSAVPPTTGPGQTRNGWTNNNEKELVNGIGEKNENSGDGGGSGDGRVGIDPGVAKLRKETNPSEFSMSLKGSRMFVIKSYSEDDVHRSIKYGIWCSTEHGNKRLDNAFKERETKGPVYLFFSVNASGHFCGVAQMTSAVDYGSKSEVWAQDKWKGLFKVRWLYVKDVPNSQLRHIRLENNENKPVTNSRDTQEVPADKGKAVLKVIHQFQHTTSLFDDFGHYEKRQAEEENQRKVGGKASD